MRKRIAGITGVALFLLAATFAPATAGGESILFGRTPEISPDGGTIAFSYGGDIWVVPAGGGEAKRLTDHVAYDGYPVWSPDGRTLAFASNIEGNFDVFTIPVTGGERRQVTFHSNTDIPCDWTPDGERILFETRRGGSEDLWLARLEGGTPIRLTGVHLEREAFADLSTDGTKLLFNDNRCTSGWWRRNFNSSDAAEVHLADFAVDGITARRFTNNSVHDLWPHFSPDGNMIYYVSGSGEPLGIWRAPLAGGGPAVQEVLLSDDVTWLSVSAGSSKMVFESGFDIWIKTLGIGEAERVAIRCATEPKVSTVQTVSFSGDVSEFQVSPDGRKVALVVHGEIFVTAAGKGGVARRVTFTPWRESDVRWLDDSKRIVYTSDRNGTNNLFTCDTKAIEETALTTGADHDTRPLPSPDGKWIAFYRGNDKIMLVDPNGGEPREMIAGRFLDMRLEPHREFCWSPDSKWIAYTSYAEDFHTDIRVRHIEEGTDEQLSFLANWNYRPVWSPGGDEIYFTSRFHGDADTYRIRLRDRKPEFKEDVLDSLYADAEADKKNENDEEDAEAERIEPVVIDFDRIDLRMSPFPGLASDESEPVFANDGTVLVFAANVLAGGKFDLWSYPTGEEAEDKKLNQLTTSEKRKGGLQVADDAVWYLESGQVKSVGVGGGDKKTLSFQAEMDIDGTADRRQMFLEGWSVLNDQFYDTDYHGVNWQRVKAKYEPVLPHISNMVDFQTFMRMMIGELGASHLNFSPADDRHADFTGELGVEFDFPLLHAEGVYRVSSVIPDSPADLDESRIEPGEYVTAIDGIALDRTSNLFQRLRRKVGDRVLVTLADNPGGKNAREVAIKPVARPAITSLKYENWVNERRELVDEWSGGRLAYLHIRAMGQSGLTRFQRELVTLADKKEGAVIDVRYNGGGNVAVHILGILERKPFLMRNFRGMPVTSETKMRSYGYEKPTALLINNHSYSNAEIFAEGFRKLGLGPIVGIPTAGSVIGTSPVRLLDGSSFRKPSWGAFTVDGENLENKGRTPDFHVESSYNDRMAGDDPQLRKAVEELLKDL